MSVSGGRDDPMNYDDEQFTEEGMCVFLLLNTFVHGYQLPCFYGL